MIRYSKNGAPRSDVKMLTGSSDAAAVRARISAAVSRMPPSSPLKRSVRSRLSRVRSRAMCGATDRRIVIFTDGGKRLLREMGTYWTCFDKKPETPGYPEERSE